MSAETRYAYVHVDVQEEDVADVSAELFDRGAEGLEQRDATTLLGPGGDSASVTLVAYFSADEQARKVAAALSERFEARVEYVVGDDWRDAWREHFKPFRIGDRLLLTPSWESVEPDSGDVVLTLDPGRAFGSGTHETTRLVLLEIERRVRGGERVLDVGCGSGVLSVAALLLGASRADSVDIDDAAVEVTRENAQLNGVAERLQASTMPVERVTARYDLVLANIEARVLIPMAPALLARVAAGGVLVLSGVLTEQEEEVRRAFAGLRHLGSPAMGEWVALVFGGDQSA